MSEFAPPPGFHKVDEPPDGAVCLGAYLAQNWRKERDLVFKDLAGRWDVSISLANKWLNSNVTPSEQQRERVERDTNGAVPSPSWLYWSWTSSPALAKAKPSPPTAIELPELGSTREELRLSVRRSKALLNHADLTPRMRGDIEGKISLALTRLASLEEKEAIEDHPAFESFCADVIAALEGTLEHYDVSPAGARTVFARFMREAEKKRLRREEAA